MRLMYCLNVETNRKGDFNMKKRVLGFILSGVMAISLLAGCGSQKAAEVQQSAETEATAETPAAENVEEEVAENVEEDASENVEAQASAAAIQVVEACGTKGDKINKVAYIPMATSTEFFALLTDRIVEELKAAGFEADYTSPEFDPGQQLEIFENYVTAGYDCIIVFPINADSMDNAVKEAREKGVKVICQVNQTSECDGWVGSSGVDMGKGTCAVTADWVNSHFADADDNSVKCAVITTRTDANNSAISDEIEKIAEYSSKIEVVKVLETTDQTIEGGQNLAENLYMTNPEVNLVIVEEPDVAIGMNNYYAGVDSPIENKADFGIFANNGGHSTYDLIVDSASDKSVLRGISSVAPLKYGVQMAINVALRLSNGEESDANFEADPVYLITKDNIADFQAIQ